MAFIINSKHFKYAETLVNNAHKRTIYEYILSFFIGFIFSENNKMIIAL